MAKRTLFALLLLCVPACAQGINGTVTGIVRDPSQAAVVGAAVTLISIDTGTAIKTESNEAGVYRFASVPIGTYELHVEFSGFKKFVQRDLVVETAQTVRADVALEVGATQESVTVTAEAPLLQRETSNLGTQVSTTLVASMPNPLTGGIRNPFALVTLTPGAEGLSDAGGGIRIAGSRTYANEVLLDGVPFSYNPTQNVAGPAAPALETVAEFRVETAIPPAEYGRTGGGVVMVASRSGTNRLRGGVFSLFRNGVLDARRYNAASSDLMRQAEFGGTLGGPVYLPRLYDGRNRTFFFTNYTGFRRLTEVQGLTATLPTAAMREGDFSVTTQRIFDPQSTSAGGQRMQFPGNRIPANRLSPFALSVQKLLPLPNAPGLANNFIGTLPNILDLNSGFVKMDHAFTDRNRLSGSYRRRQEDRLTQNGIVLPESDFIRQGIQVQNAVLAHDIVLRPDLLNRVQLGFTRFRSPVKESADVGLRVPGAYEGGFPGIAFSGQGMTRVGYGNDRTTTNNSFNLQESLAWTRGAHAMKFGIRFDLYQYNLAQPGFREGLYTFSQATTSSANAVGTGHSYASFLIGQAANANMAFNQPTGDRSRYFAVYAQDDWKAKPWLTLNYGYRWEMQVPFREMHDRLSTMDPTVPNPGAGGRLGALVFAGHGPGRSGVRNFMHTYYGAHAGRLGLALRVTSRTVVRAGAGLFYAPLAGLDNDKTGFNARVVRNSQDGGLTPGLIIDQGWPPDAVKYPPFIDPTFSNGSTATTTENRPGGSGRLSRTSQWQFSIQRMVRSTLIEASYVGTAAHGLTNNSLVNINQVDPKYLSLGALLRRSITDPAVAAAGFSLPYSGFRGTLAQSLRAFPQYQTITTLDSPTGNSTYHALFLKAEKRFSRGVQFLVSYAATKNITDVSFTNAELGAPQDQYNRRAEKSISGVDRPQRLSGSVHWELPFGRGAQGWRRHALSGWNLSGVVSYTASTPLRISLVNTLPLFNGALRPNHVSGVPIRTPVGRGEFRPLNAMTGERGDLFLNPSAFAVPEPDTFGTMGVFLPNVRGFSSRNENLSLMRRFRLAEKWRLEFRGEFFNAFNRRNLLAPVVDFTNPNFGRITGAEGPRAVQLGFRMDF